MASVEGNGGSIPFRVAANERRLDRFEEWRSQVDEQRSRQSEQMRQYHDALEEVRREVRGLRRTLLTLAVSIACSSVVFALSVLSATGKI